jgi:hypothetical protein
MMPHKISWTCHTPRNKYKGSGECIGRHDKNTLEIYYSEGVGDWRGYTRICQARAQNPSWGGWFFHKPVCPQCYETHP